MKEAYSPEEALRLVKEAETLTAPQLRALQKRRLGELVAYARAHSPYFQALYRGIPDDPDFADLPPTHRPDLTKHFDEWVTDRDVTLADVRAYLSDGQNLSKLYRDKYYTVTTSGTTDVALIMLRDARHRAVNNAVISARYYGGSLFKSVPELTDPTCRLASILPVGDFHASYIAFVNMQKALEARGITGTTLCLPIDMPTREQVEQLNAFQPEFIGGYPSFIRILAGEQAAGRLSIRPKGIGCVSEYMADETRLYIQNTFGCPVMNNYGSSEAGEIALLCKEGHLHVNADWLVLEPVDENDQPVAEGTLSDGTLLTSLSNLVQPIIRYRLSDRIRMRPSGCACGSNMPIVEIEGRKEDTLVFEGPDGCVSVSPSHYMLMGVHEPGCSTSQFLQCSPQKLEIRWIADSDADRDHVGASLLRKVRALHERNGLGNVEVALCDEAPIRGRSGKARWVMKVFEDEK